jgi:hypothetical protein
MLLVGCALPGAAEPTALPTAVQVLPTETAAPPAPIVMLVAAPESDAQLAATVAEIASAFATANGMSFEQRAAISAAELPAELSKLIVLAPDPGALDLAAAAPQAAVIAIGFTPAGPAANLQTLSIGGGSSAAAAFVAGYVAGLSAEDWRMGMLYTTATADLVDDFEAGAEYFCGSCAPVAPPYNEYPLSAQAGDASNWQAAADLLISQTIRVVYLAPELEASGAAQYLATYGVLLIGSGAPPADLPANWLASISADSQAALREQLPALLAGQAPPASNSSLALAYANPDILGSSRQAYIQLVINDLLAGFIALP